MQGEGRLIAAVTRHAPNLGKRDIPEGMARKIVTRIGLAAGALVVMLFVILPAMANTLANYIPIEREVAYGKTVVGQMERLLGGTAAEGLSCSDAKGRAALDLMTERLTAPAEMNYDLNVAVFNHPMVNAFAAPGGQIVLMRGLIKEASGPDEVAAVLAHEIGHVEARDTTRAALRTAGSAGLLSMVLGDFAGGSGVLVVAEYTLNASYTREAEALADAFAHDMLDREEFRPVFLEGKRPPQTGSAVIHTPPSGRNVRIITGSGSLPFTGVNLNRDNIVARIITASCSAKLAPMQMRGPSPKGR